MGCLSGCKVTLIAFVWFFCPMHFHLSFHVTCLRRCILTLFAFLWPKTTVLPSHCNFYIGITFSWIILIRCHYINFLTEKTYFTNQVFIERDRLWKWKFLLYKISSVSHFIGNILKNSAVRMITIHHSMLSFALGWEWFHWQTRACFDDEIQWGGGVGEWNRGDDGIFWTFGRWYFQGLLVMIMIMTNSYTFSSQEIIKEADVDMNGLIDYAEFFNLMLPKS